MIYLQESCKAHCRGYPECFKYRKLDEMKDVEVYMVVDATPSLPASEPSCV